MKNSISILGSGWLGFSLAQKLREKDQSVLCSYMSLETKNKLADAKLKSAFVAFRPEFEGESFFFDTKTLIVNIPPRARLYGQEYHIAQVKSLLAQLKVGISKIVFVSSTSVYPNMAGEAREGSELEDHYLLRAENLFFEYGEKHDCQIIVLRFGGLMGYNRNPINYIKTTDLDLHHRVNYLHRDDAVKAIMTMINTDGKNGVFNVCSPMHPTKAEIVGLEPPNKINEKKTIVIERFMDQFSFEFIYPDPLKYFYE